MKLLIFGMIVVNFLCLNKIYTRQSNVMTSQSLIVETQRHILEHINNDSLHYKDYK